MRSRSRSRRRSSSEVQRHRTRVVPCPWTTNDSARSSSASRRSPSGSSSSSPSREPLRPLALVVHATIARAHLLHPRDPSAAARAGSGSADRLICGGPREAQALAIEEPQERADENERHLVHGPRNRQDAERGETRAAAVESPRRPRGSSRPARVARRYRGTTVRWCRDGTYQRTTRPSVQRLHQHSGGQPHSRPLGLWSRETRSPAPPARRAGTRSRTPAPRTADSRRRRRARPRGLPGRHRRGLSTPEPERSPLGTPHTGAPRKPTAVRPVDQAAAR